MSVSQRVQRSVPAKQSEPDKQSEPGPSVLEYDAAQAYPKERTQSAKLGLEDFLSAIVVLFLMATLLTFAVRLLISVPQPGSQFRLFGLMSITLSAEVLLVLEAMVYGALGGLVRAAGALLVRLKAQHGVRSADKSLEAGWLRIARSNVFLVYPLEVIFGACVGTLFYLVVRPLTQLAGIAASNVTSYSVPLLTFATGLLGPTVIERIYYSLSSLRLSRRARLRAEIDPFSSTYDSRSYAKPRPEAGNEEVLHALHSIQDLIGRLQTSPILDNFDGAVAIRLRNNQGGDLALTTVDGEIVPSAPTSESCRAFVIFEARADKGDCVFQRRILINDGKDSPLVTFQVALDSETITFEPPGAQGTFQPAHEILSLEFLFKAPEKIGRHDIFVEVTQKNRLVQVVPAALMVKAS
jgi:hypothetical protein